MCRDIIAGHIEPSLFQVDTISVRLGALEQSVRVSDLDFLSIVCLLLRCNPGITENQVIVLEIINEILHVFLYIKDMLVSKSSSHELILKVMIFSLKTGMLFLSFGQNSSSSCHLTLVPSYFSRMALIQALDCLLILLELFSYLILQSFLLLFGLFGSSVSLSECNMVLGEAVSFDALDSKFPFETV